MRIQRINLLRTAVLMDWLDGTPLDQLTADDPDQATEIIAQLAQQIGRLHFNRQFTYPRIAPQIQTDFQRAVKRGVPEHLRDRFQCAHRLLDELIETTGREQVIHGDLGPQNIMITADGPRIFDPKGRRADPALELAMPLIRPLEGLTPARMVARVANRAPVFAKAIGCPPERLVRWTAVNVAHTVMCRARPPAMEHPLFPFLDPLLDLART